MPPAFRRALACRVALLSLLAFVQGLDAGAAGSAPRPNILFVISDDQSWAHTSFAGDRMVKTPHYDRVAREGVYFPHSFHVTTCTPRSSTSSASNRKSSPTATTAATTA